MSDFPTMCLSTHDETGEVVMHAFDVDAIPPFATLSQSWLTNKSEEASPEGVPALITVPRD